DEDALKIIHRLGKFGYKSYLVGGCVRDLLLGRKPKDFDIATSATPTQIKNVFNNCRIIGKRFKIVHIIFKGKIIEVTTFRSLPDHRLNKNAANGELLLKRDNNFGNSKEDAARRDFTVNALYYDPRNESIIDYVGGFDDIKNKILRVVGDPEISFKEDPVRMLRAVKISVLHGLEIDKKTKMAIKKNRLEIEKASSSRMLEEYNKIFRTWDTSSIFKGLAENHLLDVLFKESLEVVKKTPNWEENFLDTSLGKLLLIADRKLKEREELTPTIFFALIFSDIVNDALKEKGNMVPLIKAAIDPICNRLDMPRRDRERIIRIYASQKRFLKTNESNKQQNDLFRTKDFFYDSFMYFKLIAEARNDEEALQMAFFWEISARIRPDGRGNKQNNRRDKKPNPNPNTESEEKNNRNPRKKKNPYNRQERETFKKQSNVAVEEKIEKIEKEESVISEEIFDKSKDISVYEETKILTTSEMEALQETGEGDSGEENKSSVKPDSVRVAKKKRYKPKKFKKFYKKKNKVSGEGAAPQE
ncbi:MAG: polynucleotide adenylyltransferase PcnB, partial [Leptospiraceae bacterium]|nr:polynucleotide adenylyltransferase PcnB [Leptospiraceae bacterium]